MAKHPIANQALAKPVDADAFTITILSIAGGDTSGERVAGFEFLRQSRNDFQGGRNV